MVVWMVASSHMRFVRMGLEFGAAEPSHIPWLTEAMTSAYINTLNMLSLKRYQSRPVMFGEPIW